MLELGETRLRELLDEIEERRRTIGPLGEGRVELEQRALEQAGLRRDFPVGEDLQRAPHDGERLRDGRGGGGRHRAAAFGDRAADARQILVGDELVAVALEDDAGERPAANDEHLLVVLLELLDQREEVAVAADDHVRVDVRVREGHFEGIERQVDVGAVLVAAGRQVALHQTDGVLGEVAAVLARARPVGVGDLSDHLAALLQGVEDGADVEILTERRFDANLDVVEVDEHGDVETVLIRQMNFLSSFYLYAASGAGASGGGRTIRVNWPAA